MHKIASIAENISKIILTGEKIMSSSNSGNFYNNTKEQLNNRLDVANNFDIICKGFYIADKRADFFFVDGFVKDTVMQKMMAFWNGLKSDAVSGDAEDFINKAIPYVEVDLTSDINQMITSILMGMTCLLVDGLDKAILIDCRTYPARNVEEPEKDKSMRGSRDGFVETIVFNTALIRRRIRTPELTMKIMSVGKKSKTDIVISYMKDKVDKKLLQNVIDRISKIEIDSLTMNQESLAECLYKGKWINPFPKYKYTERPDTATSALLEGNIIILVDNSPSAMILPTSIFDIIEEADDYYFPPVTGTYLKVARFLITTLTLVLTPTWLLLLNNPQWIPEGLQFIIPAEKVNVPILMQLFILEFAIDGLRLASLNTPNTLSTPLSVLAGLVLGEFAVSSGWFNSETMLYMAFVALANYSQASFELGYALKFMRMIMLILTALFGIFGYVASYVFIIVLIVSNKTLSGKSYIYPLYPFDFKEIIKKFFRVSLPVSEKKR